MIEEEDFDNLLSVIFKVMDTYKLDMTLDNFERVTKALNQKQKESLENKDLENLNKQINIFINKRLQ